MPRPSKLTPQQWTEVEQRLAAGESRRALAREYGVSEGAIRQRVPTQTTQQVRIAAEKLTDGRLAVAALPTIAAQYTATSLSDMMVNTSRSIASAAQFGSATAHRLAYLANSQVAKVDDADPMSSIAALRDVGVLTKLANDSAAIGISLLSAKVKLVNGADGDGGHGEVVRRMNQARAGGVRTYLKPGSIGMDIEDVDG